MERRHSEHSVRYRMLSCILSLAMLCSLIAVPVSAEEQPNETKTMYQDIDSHWAKESIERWSEYGILKGYNGQFRPDDSITRGELAVVVDRILRYQQKADTAFSDLGEAYYTDAILRAAKAGVIQGYDGLVHPTDSVTREAAIVMLARAFGIRGEETQTPFTDQKSISAWAEKLVAAMKNNGYVNGRPNNMFCPQGAISRSEIATILDHCVAAYLTEPGSYQIDQAGIVIAAATGVTISDSSVLGNLLLAGDVRDDRAVVMENAGLTGDAIVLGGNEKALCLEGVISPAVYTQRDMKNVRVRVDAEAFPEVQSVGLSILSSTGNTLVGSGKYFDEHSGLFVLEEENLVVDQSGENGIYSMEIPQAVYMTMEAGKYSVHGVGYDKNGKPVEGADWTRTVTLDVPALKTSDLEIYPSNALAVASQEFKELTVNGTPIFVEQEYNDHAYYDNQDLDTRLRPKTHIARLAASYDSDITVSLKTSKPIHEALVRPERLVKDVNIEGNTLTFTVLSGETHPELARNIVVSVENTDKVNEDETLNPHFNNEVYADFNLLIDDMEEEKPIPGGKVVSLLDAAPGIDRTGKTIITEEMNAALASVAGKNGETGEQRKTLYIPYGVYQCGTLNLPTNAKVYLDNGACIMGTGNYQDYPQTEKLPDEVIEAYRSELAEAGLDTAYYAQQGNDNGEFMSYSRQLFIDEADHTTLFGRGTVNSNGWELANSRRSETKDGDVWEMKDGTKLRAWVDTGNNSIGWYTTETLRIQDSTNVEVKDILLRNSPAWTVHPLRCDELDIVGLKVVNDVDCGSDDGFDVDSSSNVLLDKIFYNGNDDAFVMKTTGTSGGRVYEADGTLRTHPLLDSDHQHYAAPTFNVWAQNSTLLTRMNTANRIGTEENALSVHDIHYVNNDCLDNLVCVSITPKDDAEIYNIYFEKNVYDRPKILFEIEALKRNDNEQDKQDEFFPGQNHLNYNGFTNPGFIDYRRVIPWFERYDEDSSRFETMGYFHDIYIRDNTIQNYTYMGYDGGFSGCAYQINGPHLVNRKNNNADLSNTIDYGQPMKNVTITNTLFRDAAVYEIAGHGSDHNDENGLLIYTKRLISKVENMVWGSREFTELMPMANPVSSRIDGLQVYSDQAPSVMLTAPQANLQCAPNKIENKYMQPYVTIRTLYSAQDLKNIEAYAVPAKDGEVDHVYLSVMHDGKYLSSAQTGAWTAGQTFLEASLHADSGNYVLTLSDQALSGLKNGVYTLAVYAEGDGVKSGVQTINYELAADTSNPLPPNNVRQPVSARTFTTLDLVWDRPCDYQSGDTYKVYYAPVNDKATYDRTQTVTYNMPYSGNGENGYFQGQYTVCKADLSKMTVVDRVSGMGTTLTGLKAGEAYAVYVATVRSGVESPMSKWTIAATKMSSAADTISITDAPYSASVKSGDNTAAIQKAIDACPENGTVVVPAGTFVTGALFLKDHVTLRLEEGAVLKAFTEIKGDDQAAISEYYPRLNTSVSAYAGLLNVVKVNNIDKVSGVRTADVVCDSDHTGGGIVDVSVIGTGKIDLTGLAEKLGANEAAVNVINGSYIYLNGVDLVNGSRDSVYTLYTEDSTIDLGTEMTQP